MLAEHASLENPSLAWPVSPNLSSARASVWGAQKNVHLKKMIKKSRGAIADSRRSKNRASVIASLWRVIALLSINAIRTIYTIYSVHPVLSVSVLLVLRFERL